MTDKKKEEITQALEKEKADFFADCGITSAKLPHKPTDWSRHKKSTSEQVTIDGWVARDQFDHNNLNLHCEKPYRDGNDIYYYEDEGFWDNNKEKSFPLPDEMFPEVTWQSEPKRVKITLTPIEE